MKRGRETTQEAACRAALAFQKPVQEAFPPEPYQHQDGEMVGRADATEQWMSIGTNQIERNLSVYPKEWAAGYRKGFNEVSQIMCEAIGEV